jgi:hypothetical protein
MNVVHSKQGDIAPDLHRIEDVQKPLKVFIRDIVWEDNGSISAIRSQILSGSKFSEMLGASLKGVAGDFERETAGLCGV